MVYISDFVLNDVGTVEFRSKQMKHEFSIVGKTDQCFYKID